MPSIKCSPEHASSYSIQLANAGEDISNVIYDDGVLTFPENLEKIIASINPNIVPPLSDVEKQMMFRRMLEIMFFDISAKGSIEVMRKAIRAAINENIRSLDDALERARKLL